jgi:hypothetical protein
MYKYAGVNQNQVDLIQAEGEALCLISTNSKQTLWPESIVVACRRS